MRHRGLIIFLVLFAIFFCNGVSYSQSSTVTNGLNYLSSTQSPDGSWGTESSGAEILPSTIATIETLKALNQTNTQTYFNALVWLQSQGLQTTDYFSERIHALMASGADRDVLLSYLDDLIGAWGGYNDYDVNNFDTALALQALKAVNYSDTNVISTALAYLISTRNTDGGWGFYKGDDSNVYMTALVLQTLSQFKSTYDLHTQITSAASYFFTKQNPDCGFGSPVSTVYETSLAVIALIESGQGQAQPLQDAITYLTATQLANGSWDNDPYSTALALRALAMVKPNLTISSSDITFTPAYPTAGNPIEIKALVHNTGPAQADAVLVRFYDGDPAVGGSLIGETTIASIPAYGSTDATISYTIPAASSKAVFVSVDPLNTIDESDETDNTASKNLGVGFGTNLSVSNIDFAPATPAIDQPVTMTFTVNNIGETTVNNVLLEYYQADDITGNMFKGNVTPGQYTKIGQIVISELLPGASLQVQSIKAFAAGWHNIKVVVDPLNAVAETDETDNALDKWLVALPMQIDLVVNPELTVLPDNPKENETITVHALAYNSGGIPASAVTIALYDGNPLAGGTKLSERIVEMLPLDYKQLEFQISLLRGTHDIYLVIDPLQLIADSNRGNNQAMKTLKVELPSDVDFSITPADIVFAPATALPGNSTTITATVHNLGTRTEAVAVSFYEGNPSYGGKKITDTSTSVPGNSIVNVSAAYTVSDKPTTIYVVLDEPELVYEKSEDNNRAFKRLTIPLPDLAVRDKDIKINKMSNGSIYISPLIRNFGGVDAANVTVTVYDGKPGSGGVPIASQVIALITSYSAKRINIPYTPTIGRHDIHVVADPNNTLTEITKTNNTGLKVIYRTDPNGPDLKVTAIDASGLMTDTQTLLVSGSLNVTIENAAGVGITTAFHITAYEDINKNSLYDEGIDNRLGEIIVNGLSASSSGTFLIPVSGQTAFRDNHIHVMADSRDNVFERNEENNDRHHKQDCAYVPAQNYDVIEKWTWKGSAYEPTKNQVRMAPLVANMNDDNGDGIIDENDIPDVIFVSAGAPTSNWNQGVLRIISGKDGSEIMSVSHPDGIYALAGIAVGDIDNDGESEIIVALSSNKLAAYKRDGTLLWVSAALGSVGGRNPIIADLDNDGNPEILMGTALLNNKGNILWRATNYLDVIPVAVDLNNDDKMEFINGAAAYDSNGVLRWFNSYIGRSGYNAIGNFDGAPYPEVVFSGVGQVYLMRNDMKTIWAFKDPAFRYDINSAPAVGDVDGDEKPEIAVSGHNKLVMLNSNGTKRWDAVVYDATDGVISPIMFDLNGNGKAKVVVNDGQNFFIFDGDTGQVLFKTPNPAGTFYEVPAVADVDNDGHVEFIVFGGQHQWNDPYLGGIRVFTDRNGNWVNSRRIWNQHNYHVTNIDEDGYIPLREENSWEKYNCYRCNVPIKNALDAPDLTASRIIIDSSAWPISASLTVRIGNAGNLGAKEGISVSFYDGNPANNGKLIGSTVTTKHLNPEDYEDVSILWQYPPTGIHAVYVVADSDSKLRECDETNNTALAQAVFGEVSLPDLSISASDIIIVPPVIEGQTATITAIIHNTGTLGASDVVVSFYDGDINYGGTLIGSVIKSYIDAGATALAEVSWNTMGQSGRNYVHVVVDPQGLIPESNENNNAALLPVDVSPPEKPDLAITSSDITFSNLNPQEGEPLTLSATVHNFGVSSASIKVNLYDGNRLSGGVLLSTYTIAQIIPFGGQTEIAFAIDTVGLSGSHAFHIVLDPEHAIDEINETNNVAWNSLTIGPSGLSLGVSADKASYHSNNNVLITVSTGNLTELSRSGYLEVRITDLNSNVVSMVALNQAVILGSNENITTSYTWNTGQTLSGDYRVNAVFMENGNIRAKDDSGISILKDMTIASKVTTDRIAYFSNQPVTMTSTISSGSANYIFENLTAKIAVSDQQSGSSLHTETYPIPILLQGQSAEFKTYWNTATNPPGAYPVALEIRDASGALVSTTAATLTISSEIKPSKLLKGQISVDRQSILQGEPLNITYQVTNVGNMDLSQVNLSIKTVHVVNLSVYDTLTDQAAVLMGASYANAQQLATGTYSAKDYLVILAASINGIEESLAGTYFRVEGAPSAPSLNAPLHGNDVETETPLLSINNATDPNDDRLTYEFQVYADQGLTTLVAESTLLPEGASITSWQVTATLQENSWYFWRARAYDNRLYGQWMDPAAFRVNVTNEPPTAPTLSAPADSSYVDTLLPILMVSNSTDPDSVNLTYNFVLASDPGLSTIVASQMGVFEMPGSTSWQVTVPLQENSWYYWKAQADDWLITGPWMTTAKFFVNTTNEAPSAPVIIDPLDNSETASRDVYITVSNSADPDSTAITYLFDVDSALTFNTPDRVISGSVQQGQNSTSWLAAGLKDNTYYYARVKASDGSAESPLSAVVGFFVNTANDAPTVPVLANPSNGAGVNSFNPILSVHNSTDIDGDILTYEFELYGDAAMTNLIISASGIQETPQITGWTVPVSLTENNTYFWRARAFDGQFYSPWMALASFIVNTANDAPSAPTLNAPAQGSSLSTLLPTLTIYNATDPDSDTLTYDFEVYTGTTLVRSMTAIPQNASGITSVALSPALSDNTTYTWRARAYDGDRYGAWMDMAAFSIHLPSTNVTATIDFDPDTLNQKSKGNWVTVYIELPVGYNVANINISSVRLNGTIPAVTWPYAIGDYDHDGIPDLMVKFDRNAVINLLPNGDRVKVTVTGTASATTFEGVDYIRVIH